MGESGMLSHNRLYFFSSTYFKHGQASDFEIWFTHLLCWCMSIQCHFMSWPQIHVDIFLFVL